VPDEDKAPCFEEQYWIIGKGRYEHWHHGSQNEYFSGTDQVAVITLIDDERYSLSYDADSKVIYHTVKRSISGAAFRELLTRGAECLEQNQVSKWLSDDRKNGPVGPEDSTWGETIWGPRVLRAGFKFWAIVVPSSAVGSLQMRRFAKLYRERGVAVEIFDDLQRAWTWIKSVD